MPVGKKITIYLATGLPKGVREVRIDQWSGKAICGPRNALGEIINRPEAENGACIYFLVGSPDEGGLINVYVGEADGFKSRIRDHDYKKDWWQDVVVFVSQDSSLTKTSGQYLECICIERLRATGKCKLMNANRPTTPTILREDISGLETFYENISIIMPLLGYDIFVKETINQVNDEVKYPLFECKKGSDILATAKLLEDGKMLVFKSSTASAIDSPSMPYKRLKNELVKMGRLVPQGSELVFSEDYVFDSSSAACDVVLGRSESGPSAWKTKGQNVQLREYLNTKLGLSN